MHLQNLLSAFDKKTWARIGLGLVFFLVPLYSFVQLADEVLENDTLPYDQAILYDINQFAHPVADVVVVAITQLGGIAGISMLLAGAVVLLARRRMYRMAGVLIAGVGGAGLINLFLKAMFTRARPELWERIVTETSYSFPSGHAMASSAFAFSVIVVLWNTRYRTAAVIGGIGYIIVIGLTRLYLGVHYPTDILGGWLVSAAWIAVLLMAISIGKNTLHTSLSKKLAEDL